MIDHILTFAAGAILGGVGGIKLATLVTSRPAKVVIAVLSATFAGTLFLKFKS